MNAGGHGSDIAATLVEVRLLDLRTGEDGAVPAADLHLGYRRSSVRPDQVVVPGHVPPGRRATPSTATAEIAEIVRWRRENQPGGPNAGSVFTNPEGDSAGRLIEAAGAKGLRRGHRRGVDQARQLHPGRPRRPRRRRPRPDGRGPATGSGTHSGVELEAETRLVGFDEEAAP